MKLTTQQTEVLGNNILKLTRPTWQSLVIQIKQRHNVIDTQLIS